MAKKYIYFEYHSPNDSKEPFSRINIYDNIENKNGFYKPCGNLITKRNIIIPKTVDMAKDKTSGAKISDIRSKGEDYIFNLSAYPDGMKESFASNNFAIQFKLRFKDLFASEYNFRKASVKFGHPLLAVQDAINNWIWNNINNRHKDLSQIGFLVQNEDNSLDVVFWKRYKKDLLKWTAGIVYIEETNPLIGSTSYWSERVNINSSVNDLNQSLAGTQMGHYGYQMVDPDDTLYNIGESIFARTNAFKSSFVVIDLTFSVLDQQDSIANAGEWDIGSEATNLPNYCFYCKDATTDQHLSYWECNIKSPFTTIKSHNTWMHKCSIHGSTPMQSIDEDTGKTTDSYVQSLVYPPRTTGALIPESILSYNKVERLNDSKVGEYIDGVARTPFLMMELRANDTSTKGYNISIPANSIVSFNHVRNMRDSYNTFELQVYDKDAMEIEAKLVLGFRTVVFYYTDFTSTSKRYKGLILDYRTTIVNKGIMLTISGYSSNVNAYIGKDSIPWKSMCEANSTSFYYWMNEAGEYHGEVRRLQDGTGLHYNSVEGTIVSPSYQIPESEMVYSLRVNNPNPTSQDDAYVWVTYDEFYRDKVEPKDLKNFEPKPKLYKLSSYNSEIDRVVSLYGGMNLIDKRPSDIVKLICIMNGWSFRVVQTKEVSEIPDQISMSYIEYIKEKLIPISISEGSKASTQYYFWFDDQGVANYAPAADALSDKNIKKLYFNSREHKDSYPLIGFTSSSNGSVLMAVNARNSMEGINALTGDELSFGAVTDISTDPKYLGAIVETADWYQTSKLIQEQDTLHKLDYVKLITYQDSNTLPSEKELRNKLINRWGEIARYTWKAQLEVYGAVDLTPGEYIDVYIYLDEGKRTEGAVSEEVFIKDDGSEGDGYTEYRGNLTLHHSSGRYIINKITDNISAGRYVSSLEVLKIDSTLVNDLISFDSNEKKEKTEKTVTDSFWSGSQGTTGLSPREESMSKVVAGGSLDVEN